MNGDAKRIGEWGELEIIRLQIITPNWDFYNCKNHGILHDSYIQLCAQDLMRPQITKLMKCHVRSSQKCFRIYQRLSFDKSFCSDYRHHGEFLGVILRPLKANSILRFAWTESSYITATLRSTLYALRFHSRICSGCTGSVKTRIYSPQ
jgi:hypothetical protein